MFKIYFDLPVISYLHIRDVLYYSMLFHGAAKLYFMSDFKIYNRTHLQLQSIFKLIGYC